MRDAEAKLMIIEGFCKFRSAEAASPVSQILWSCSEIARQNPPEVCAVPYEKISIIVMAQSVGAASFVCAE
jgi:hypothetical protein